MKKKIIKTKEYTCGQCQRGEWSTKDIDQRTPEAGGGSFVKVCPLSQWAVNASGQHVCLDITKACDKFVLKI